MRLLVGVSLLVAGMAIMKFMFDPAVLTERISNMQVEHDKLFATVESQQKELAAIKLHLGVAAGVTAELSELREMLGELRP